MNRLFLVCLVLVTVRGCIEMDEHVAPLITAYHGGEQ